MFLGYKFETLSLLDGPWDSTSREFIESRENKVVIGGEVDAREPIIITCLPINR